MQVGVLSYRNADICDKTLGSKLRMNARWTSSELPEICLWQVSDTASFQNDLGLDSLDEVELVMAIEEEFAVEIPDADADKIKSTSDAIDYIASNPRAK